MAQSSLGETMAARTEVNCLLDVDGASGDAERDSSSLVKSQLRILRGFGPDAGMRSDLLERMLN